MIQMDCHTRGWKVNSKLVHAVHIHANNQYSHTIYIYILPENKKRTIYILASTWDRDQHGDLDDCAAVEKHLIQLMAVARVR